ncbi:MAG: hypothetical protein OCD03_13150 [Hyphomicrobiales bacterium]
MAQSVNELPQGEDGINVLNSNPERIDQQPFLQLVGRMQNAKQNLNTSKSKYDGIRKEMKKDGVNLKMLDFVTKLMDLADEDIVTMFHQIEDYMKFMGIDALRQMDLFAETDNSSDKAIEQAAFDSGYRAAHLDLNDTNPYEQGENLHEHWLNGYSEGEKSVSAAELKSSAKKPELVN